jgi:hypothetical protein
LHWDRFGFSCARPCRPSPQPPAARSLPRSSVTRANRWSQFRAFCSSDSPNREECQARAEKEETLANRFRIPLRSGPLTWGLGAPNGVFEGRSSEDMPWRPVIRRDPGDPGDSGRPKRCQQQLHLNWILPHRLILIFIKLRILINCVVPK